MYDKIPIHQLVASVNIYRYPQLQHSKLLYSWHAACISLTTTSLQSLRQVHHIVLGDSERLHDSVSGSREAELVGSDHDALQTHVLVPQPSDPGLDGEALGDSGWEHGVPVLDGLAVEPLEARHGDDADSRTEYLSGINGPL